MQYRVFFTTGQSILITEKHVSALTGQELNARNINFLDGDKLLFRINLEHVTHIISEPEVSSGITSSPSPDDLRDQRHKQEEAIKSDPKAILERATKKYDEGQ